MLWLPVVAQDAQRTCARKLSSGRLYRAFRKAQKQLHDMRTAQPERSTSGNESDWDDAGDAEVSHGPRCEQCGSSEVLWSAGPTLCTECEMLNVCVHLEAAPAAAPLPAGAALQAAPATPGAAPTPLVAAQPAFAHPQVQSAGAHQEQTLPAVAPAQLSISELASAPNESIAADAGGSAERSGTPLPSPEEGFAAAAATPQPPSVSPPQPLVLAPTLPAVLPTASLPLVQPPAAMLPLMMHQLLAARQAPPPAPPALPLALPHILTPTAAILLAAAAGAHASMVDAQIAEAQLRASQALAAALSVPVVNAAMLPQLHQLPMPHLPMPLLQGHVHTTGRAAVAMATAAHMQRLGQQQRLARRAEARAEAEAGREEAARAVHEQAVREGIAHKIVEDALAEEARRLRGQAEAEGFVWPDQAPPPPPPPSLE